MDGEDDDLGRDENQHGNAARGCSFSEKAKIVIHTHTSLCWETIL
jgi:hypothetical protein